MMEDGRRVFHWSGLAAPNCYFSVFLHLLGSSPCFFFSPPPPLLQLSHFRENCCLHLAERFPAVRFFKGLYVRSGIREKENGC